MPSATARRARAALLLLLGVAALPATASAQRRRPRAATPAIEIRGQVPTPQVVTVRPREIPEFSRQVLVPNFYDRQFWPGILPGYEIVSQRMLSGALPSDSALAAAARGGAAGGAVPPASSTPTVPATPPSSAPAPAPASADSARRPPGTAPAR